MQTRLQRFFPLLTAIAAGRSRLALIAGLCGCSLFDATRVDAAYALSVPDYKGRPGTTVRVPVSLSDAKDVAGVLIRINYAPQVLELQSASAGGLGSQFTFNYTASDGVVTMMFSRPTGLASGSGILAMLDFSVNEGAQSGDNSELAIAQFDLSDETGVLRPNWSREIALNNGSVTAQVSGIVDNDGDGLPDHWELKHGFNPLVANNAGDEDGDGFSNSVEFAFGLNPRASDRALTQHGTDKVDDVTYLTVTFRRQMTGIHYEVQQSTDLVTWTPIDLPGNRVGAATDHGDGTQTWRVRGTIPLSGNGAQPRAFLRVKASPNP
jgi:hypothetical protein